ncbi:MAG: multidrug ABC transporter substrate-binding protein [candidate division NC10 bacterium RBG_16_65_8]|nr:MAG: multidrug ABC transporter substrate-binding protein [candidate division NC10 bacterium RBG_16_65_8]
MYLFASIRIALRALRINKLRSALTMLGIVIGVGAVIAMVAVGAGAAQRIKDQISSIGSNLLMVLPGSAMSGGMRMGHGSTMTLTEDDARAIAAEIPGVTNAGGVMRGTAQIVFGNQNWNTGIQGVTADYADIRDWEVAQGKFFGQEDIDGFTKVAVLGLTVKESLFGDGDAVGQIIRIRKVPFTVVGVMAGKGQTTWGQDQDDTVIIPLSTAKKRVLGVSQANARFVGVIQVKVAAPELMAEVEQQVTDLLRQRHRLQPYQENDFQVRNLSDMFAAQEAASKTMTVLLAAIASVSLLVGGIGIMNIMLVSVTERTREIGLRMAVGARSRDILGQFLIEAVTLALIGGVLGISLGVGASKLIATFANWNTLITPASIAMAFGSAAFIGVFFGYYPAQKAAYLDPIEALRYE